MLGLGRKLLCLFLVPLIVFPPSFAGAQTDQVAPPPPGDEDSVPLSEDGVDGDSAPMMTSTVAGRPEVDVGRDLEMPHSFLFSGAATYKIPIEVPPGRADVAPNLSMNSSSYRQNGWLGVGWDLDPGSIQRATRRGVNYNRDLYTATINGASVDLVHWDSSVYAPNVYGAKIEGTFTRFRKYPDKYSEDNRWMVTSSTSTAQPPIRTSRAWWGTLPGRSPSSGIWTGWRIHAATP